jgi:hypothetical protein
MGKTPEFASCALRAPGQQSSPGHPNRIVARSITTTNVMPKVAENSTWIRFKNELAFAVIYIFFVSSWR